LTGDDRPAWLRWAERLQAMAQAGLTYAHDPYDLDRYRELRAIAVEMAARHLGLPAEAVAPGFAAGTGYPTPKVDVRAAVFRDGRLLFVRERAIARWSLPGGWADVGQSPGEVAAKETLEESGFRVRPVKLLAVLDKSRQDHPPAIDYVYKLFIRCVLEGGEAQTSHETDAVGFFGPDDLPELETGRVTRAQVRRIFEHEADPSLPADFD
jgi:ADP-ribose pyrophosphatase YjhB (NUDIX family)